MAAVKGLFRTLKLVLIAVLLVSLSGCASFEILKNKAEMELDPTLKNKSLAKTENNVFVIGRIEGEQDEALNMAVLAVSDRYKTNEIVRAYFMNTPSSFILYLPKAQYRMYVLADLDHDGVFRDNEMVGRIKGLLDVGPVAGERLMEIEPIVVNLGHPEEVWFHIDIKAHDKISSLTLSGITVDLNDELFKDDNGKIGESEPAKFMARVPSMLYTVKGDITRTPVVFVHGVTGTPRNWQYISQRVQESGFHPWFFYYPSGERIGLNGDLLYRILEERLPFDNMILVAHSLGGLVAKSTITKYTQKRRSDYIKMYISFDTSYGGVESAKEGVKRLKGAAPPVWKDIATGSAFLKANVDAWPMPKQVDFRLFFGFKSKKKVMLHSGDGAISLKSQLNPFAQSASTRMYGFYSTHEGILTSKGAIDRFMAVLKSTGLGKKNGRTAQSK